MFENDFDRRDFLKGTTAFVLGGSALLSEKLMAAESRKAPVRIAVIGTGSRGTFLTRRLATIEAAQIVAVCDNYPPHLEIGKEAAGGVKGYSNYRNMLKEMRPEAVIIATPLFTHAEIALEAMDYDCHVFCEKTMTYSIAEADEMVAVSQKKGLVCQVGLQRHANAVYEQAHELILDGMLGEITTVKCQWHRNGSWRRALPVEPGDPDYDRLEQKLNWRLYDKYSLGLMTELASHQIDVTNWMLGSQPKRVSGLGGIDYYRDGREVYDNVFLHYEYEVPREAGGTKRVICTYSSIQTNAYEGASELIMGTKGTLYLTQGKGMFFQEAGARTDSLSTGQVKSGNTLKVSNDPWKHRGAPYELDVEGDDSRNQLVLFVDAVANEDTETIVDFNEGRIDAAGVIIGQKAMKTGQTLDIPQF
jgi:predicted dehydrogenase